MRCLLAPLMLLLVAASSSLAIAAVTVLRSPSLVNTGPDRVQVLMLSGPAPGFLPQSQRLRLLAHNHESGLDLDYSFDLDVIDLSQSGLRGLKQESGQRLWLYQIAEADHQRYELVQERLHLWGQPGGAERGDFALQAFVMLAGCKLPSPLGSAAVSGKPGSVWISLDAGSNFDDLAHLQIPVVPARSEIAKVRAAEAKDRTGSTSGLFPHADRQPSVTTSPGLHPALQLC